MRASSSSSAWGSWGGIVMGAGGYPLLRRGGPKVPGINGVRVNLAVLKFGQKRQVDSDPNSDRNAKLTLTPSLSVGLAAGLGVGEGGDALARVVHRADAGVGRHVDLEALGVGDLGDEADVRDRGRVAEAERAGSALGEHGLERVEPFAYPVAVPVVAPRLVDLELLREVLQHAQVVERVDVAGDRERDRAHPRAILETLGQKRRQRMLLVEVLDDRERLREAPLTDHQRRHEPLRVQLEVAGRALFALAQVDEAALGREPLQVQGDAHAVRGGGAEVIVEEHGQRILYFGRCAIYSPSASPRFRRSRSCSTPTTSRSRTKRRASCSSPPPCCCWW